MGLAIVIGCSGVLMNMVGVLLSILVCDEVVERKEVKNLIAGTIIFIVFLIVGYVIMLLSDIGTSSASFLNPKLLFFVGSILWTSILVSWMWLLYCLWRKQTISHRVRTIYLALHAIATLALVCSGIGIASVIDWSR